jgi:hypothetical protein
LVVTVATFVVDEVQTERFDTSCVDPSEKFPVAVNCCCVPTSIVGADGDTVIELRDALLTVNEALPETPPDVAVIVAFPAATAVATPFVPAVLLMVATAVADELQFTELVRFCVLPSLNVPVATNWAVVVGAIFAVVVVTAIEFKVGGGGGPAWPPEPPPQPDITTANDSSNTARARFTQTSQKQPKIRLFPPSRQGAARWGTLNAGR